MAFIAASAALAGYQAARRLLDPVEVRALGLVAAAAVIGFAGNELVARYRIRVGREIGSAALVADGLHARTDGRPHCRCCWGLPAWRWGSRSRTRWWGCSSRLRSWSCCVMPPARSTGG